MTYLELFVQTAAFFMIKKNRPSDILTGGSVLLEKL
jgi:hypothetical protein